MIFKAKVRKKVTTDKGADKGVINGVQTEITGNKLISSKLRQIIRSKIVR